MFIPGRTYKWTDTNGRNWSHGKEYIAVSKDSIYTYHGNVHKVISPRTYDFFKLVPEEVVSRDTKKHSEEYEFRCGSPDIIDLDEVPLTRKNPVAIVKRSDGVHTLLLHQSIYDKADAAGMLEDLTDVMKPYYWDDEWIPYGSKVLSNALNVIKKVRCAPFKNSKEVVCKVSYPRI